MNIENFILPVFIVIAFLLLVISFLVKKTFRIIIWLFIIIMIIGYITMWFLRPSIDHRNYEKTVVMVQEYIEEHHPNEEWSIVEDRPKKSAMWGIEVGVVFQSEPTQLVVYAIDDGKVIEAYRTD